MKGKKNYVSTTEAAQIMGISRVAVFKQIKKGKIKAEKVGRNYIIDKRSLSPIYQDLTPSQKKKVEKAVKKAVRDYGEALRKLGKD